MRLQPESPAPLQRAAMAAECDTETLVALTERLARCADKVLALHAEESQFIRISSSVTQDGLLSCRREVALLQITEVLLADIVTHAMHRRLRGRIAVALAVTTGGPSLLTVTHDGWNLEAPPAEGWLDDIHALVAVQRGTMTMSREEHAVITVALPRQNPHQGTGH